MLTSDSEGLSNVILEAMAAGLPVVTYDVGGNAELVNTERGALVAAGDEAGVCRCGRADTCGMTSSVRQQMGDNARRFAEENFGLERVRGRYRELYQDLLQERRPRLTANDCSPLRVNATKSSGA